MNIEHLSKITETLTEEEGLITKFNPDDDTPFPLDALPDTLKEVAKEVSQAYQAPIDLVAPQTIAVLSACLGKGINLRPTILIRLMDCYSCSWVHALASVRQRFLNGSPNP